MKYIKLILILLLFLLSCKNNNNIEKESIETEIDSINTIDTAHAREVAKIFYNVPSPLEMASLLHKAGAEYIEDILNSPNNHYKYLTISDAALNLGIYGADLSYTRMFDQIQESVKYLSALRTLSDELGISNDKGSKAITRLENNMNNRDSILTIITETYANADEYLNRNDRGNTATLIILGGWVEALYIATSICDSTNNTMIINRIAEQKYSLNNLIELLKSYPEDTTIKYYLPKMNKLKKIFDKIKIDYEAGDVLTDEENKITTINSKVKVNVNYEEIKEIHEQILKIRTEMINL